MEEALQLCASGSDDAGAACGCDSLRLLACQEGALVATLSRTTHCEAEAAPWGDASWHPRALAVCPCSSEAQVRHLAAVALSWAAALDSAQVVVYAGRALLSGGHYCVAVFFQSTTGLLLSQMVPFLGQARADSEPLSWTVDVPRDPGETACEVWLHRRVRLVASAAVRWTGGPSNIGSTAELTFLGETCLASYADAGSGSVGALGASVVFEPPPGEDADARSGSQTGRKRRRQ